MRLVILLGLLVLNGCHKETFDSEVVIHPATQFAYEIRIHSHSEGRGNPHDPFDFTKQKWETRYSLCVNSLRGKVNATDLVLTQLENCQVNLPFHADLRGYIEFWEGCLTIALEEAVYDKDGLPKNNHVPVKANWTYKISRVLDKPSEPTTSCKAKLREH